MPDSLRHDLSVAPVSVTPGVDRAPCLCTSLLNDLLRVAKKVLDSPIN